MALYRGGASAASLTWAKVRSPATGAAERQSPRRGRAHRPEAASNVHTYVRVRWIQGRQAGATSRASYLNPPRCARTWPSAPVSLAIERPPSAKVSTPCGP